MVQVAFIFTFIISIATAAIGILLSQKLRTKSPSINVFTKLFYQQILIFIFALYAIWGQVVSNIIFSTDIINIEIINKISLIVTSLSIPFLLVSWFFITVISLDVAGTKSSNLKAFFILISSLFIVTFCMLLLKNQENLVMLMERIFLFENLLISIILMLGIIRIKVVKVNNKTKIILPIIVLLFGGLTALGIVYYRFNIWITIVFIIFFFITNILLPIAFTYFMDFSEIRESESNFSFENICRKYEISKREKEIIINICEGMTNNEIANKLFITLQTVKDHTSRIYLKTEVKNRTQLANLFREYIKK